MAPSLRLPASLLALLCMAATPSARSEEEHYRIDPAHTFPTFEVSHVGFSFHRGRFNRSQGHITLDQAAGTGRIDVSIEADSIDTGDETLEKVLRGSSFLDVARHPQIRFTGDRIHFQDGIPKGVDGELTLRGVTRSVGLAINHFHCGLHPLTRKQTCGANAVTIVQRSEFGMTHLVPMVGDEVRIEIQIEAPREE
ncbi:YceI family protein [Denitratisoma oestradiolicum]|uniref:Lipid/polyisoprenoid-binding YceI-like domain-containing protein n=1 Tax=Denitratisoma oestradiolicum TaxID=311182 RepID=A0A6S6XZ41_9PROT|nr:YceI family protein [Denitratisoma oestradiolicum]TWO78946.1 hypothetical protein CBW56_17460 [Denitratisoma oestradiolicum]CAB1370328.1 conserved exported protein of unknown function [Denitratisoma oestradiolicum]